MFFKGNPGYYYWLNMRHTGDGWVHLGTGHIQSVTESYWYGPSITEITECCFYNEHVLNTPLGTIACTNVRYVMCHLWVPSC